jgi:phosphoribosylglycinamide formyltransferase-1
LAVLVSGSGTLLEAILGEDIDVAVVAADRPCRGLEIAGEAGVDAVLVERTTFGPSFDRDSYTAQVVDALKDRGVDTVAMAGFGTVMPRIVDAFPGRVLNTHPALLPSFKGWHAVRDALAYGVKVTGCTVHLVDENTDEGVIVAQEAVPVLDGDDETTLHERIKAVERRIYPEAIRRLMDAEGS